VIDLAYENLPACDARPLHLGMAAEAKIGVALNQQLAVYGAMRVVANCASFPQGFVLENERLRLFPVALPTGLVEPCHCQPAGRFLDIHPVRVMALNAVHSGLDYRVVLGEGEFGMDVQVAFKAGRRVFAGIDDESPSAAAQLDVPATRSMARFAPALAGHGCRFHVKPRVRAGWKHTHVIGVAILASLVAHVVSAGNLQWVRAQGWFG
jgi:hypothetical protein